MNYEHPIPPTDKNFLPNLPFLPKSAIITLKRSSVAHFPTNGVRYVTKR